MAQNDLTLAVRLYLDSLRFAQGLGSAGRGVAGFTGKARHEFEALRRSVSGVTGTLAGVGVTLGATQQIMASARLDKSLTQIGQTAGASRDEIAGLRRELFTLARETGQPIDDLKEGFNSLIQSGLNWRESLAVIRSINTATAVTGANATVLAAGLTVAGEQFQFDLSKPETAKLLLDQMVVAGRLANAELDSLSGIFARVGGNARSAGMGFEQTLAFIEGLSMVERQPERLATLADSTLRLFNNLRYQRAATAATGVQFNDEKGARRDPIQVLRDFREQFNKLRTDAQRQKFIFGSFGATDLDTQRGLQKLLTGDSLELITDYQRKLKDAGSTLGNDLGQAIDNSVDQVGRLKAVLREAADGFAAPINGALKSLIQRGLDSKAQGGLELSGGQILGGGVATLVGGALAARYGGAALKGIGGKLFGTAGGVAAGQALEQAGLATPVFVVNMPAGGMAPGLSLGGAPGALTTGGIAGAAGRTAATVGGWRVGAAALGSVGIGGLPALGAGAMATAAAAAVSAGVAGYGIGTLINEGLDYALARLSNGRSRSLGDLIYNAVTPGEETGLTARQGLKGAAMLGGPVSMALFSITEAITNALRPAAPAQSAGVAPEMQGTLKIEIDSAGRPRVRELSTNSRVFDIDVFSGPIMVMPS